MSVVLDRLASTWAVVRLPAGSGWPHWASWSREFVSVSRTPRETSVICEERLVPASLNSGVVERGFAAYCVRGPLEFSVVGILASVATPLAAAGIPLLAVSTFDTDYVLVRETSVAVAEDAWRTAGILLGGATA